MRLLAAGWVAVATLILGGCGAGEADVDLAAEEQAIRQIDRDWMAAIEARDAEAIGAFFAADGMVLTQNGYVTGPESVTSVLREMMGQLPEAATYTFEPEHITVAASGDMAFERGSFALAIPTPDGPVTDSGRYGVVWRKIDGQWKVVLDAPGSDRPPEG